MPEFLNEEELNKITETAADEEIQSGNFKKAILLYNSIKNPSEELLKKIILTKKAIIKMQKKPQKIKNNIPTKSFKDFIGNKNIIDRFKNTVILSNSRPDLFKKYDLPNFFSFILYGAPGTGKTYMVEALAGETKRNLISVNLNDILSKYVGESEKAIHSIFEDAKKTTPSIIFFDEFDILGAKRESSAEEVKTVMGNLTAQLLTEMSNISNQKENILVIAATNRIWDIDSALLRSKRFENKIYINLPSKKDRENLFRYYLKNKPIKDMNYSRLARATAFYSPADIEKICKNAAEQALKIDQRINKTQFITTIKILRIINSKEGKPSTEKWFYETRKEMIGYFKKDSANKKIWMQGKLMQEERGIYQDYIKEIKSFSKNKIIQKVYKFIALYLI